MQLLPSFVVVQRQKFIFLLSAELHTNKKEVNEANTAQLKADLVTLGLPFEENIGVYKNSSEVSFVVVADSLEHIETLRSIARHFQQESVLVINQAQQAFLVYSDKTKPEEYKGHWKSVTKREAEACDGYTTRKGVYYVCKLD